MTGVAEASYVVPTPALTATPANTPVPTATAVPTATPPNTPVPTATAQPTATPPNTPVPTATVVPTATPYAGARAVFGGSSGLGALGVTMPVSLYKPTVGITLTRVSGIIVAAGTCAACGVTDTTFRITDGVTNSDCTNASAITCTTAAGTVFFCTPSNTSRAADQQLTLETVTTGGTCTTSPIMGINAEFSFP
jgi:hypothetical protein